MIKFFVISAAALLISANAHAVGCDALVLGISGCFTGVSVDSGTGRSCDSTTTGCDCAALDSVVRTSSCPFGWSQTGLRMDGKLCCHNDMAASKAPVDSGRVVTNASNGLS